MDIPAIEVTTDRDPPRVGEVNTCFCREFSVNQHLCGERVKQAAQREDTPLKSLPTQSDADTAELDLVHFDSVTYLRKRLWASDYLIETYHPAGDDLPHHRHISVLHRVFRHNLRNGINTIIGWSNVISECATSDPEQVATAANTILEQANELARISEEAHRLERLLHTDTEMQSVSLTEFVETAAAECRQRFADGGDIHVDIPANLTVIGNDKLRFVLDNLIDNALRHNPGDTTVMISAHEQLDRNMVTLHIEDDGQGIPLVEKEIVTGDSDINQLNHGSGLGLWLVRWVLDQHYASVEVSTANSAGTTFNIELHQ
jgi:nitrogen-specific signal transduction histidine kinase